MVSIITDSSSGITVEEALASGVTVMPLTIIFGTEEYRDGIDLTADNFYKKLLSSKDFPHTAQLTEEQIASAVEEGLKKADEVIIFPISSALSGSYERCRKVAERYKNVYVFDTKCTTVMLKMLVWEALKHADKSAEEVMRICAAYRPKLKLYAVLDTLEYLGKGGRISKTSALLGTALKIKPVITVNAKGEVEVLSKQFGIAKGIGNIISRIDKNGIDYQKPVFLIYTMDQVNSSALASKSGITFSHTNNICPVIGVHIGPCAAGIAYAQK